MACIFLNLLFEASGSTWVKTSVLVLLEDWFPFLGISITGGTTDLTTLVYGGTLEITSLA